MVGAEFVPEHPAEFPAEAAGYGAVRTCFAVRQLRVFLLVGPVKTAAQFGRDQAVQISALREQ